MTEDPTIYERGGKRCFDVVVAALALAVLMPLLLVIAGANRLEDGGPALFRQRRVGRGGLPFTLVKFRSMPLATPDIPSSLATALRVTRVGRFLRRSNIDELPQLLNVIRGDMSIVGPRPPLFAQQRLVELRAAAGVTELRPGLTGLAQVMGYTGMSDEVKAGWDSQYRDRITLLGDLQIIVRTFGYLRRPPPVY